jgi:hypothetical protein
MGCLWEASVIVLALTACGSVVESKHTEGGAPPVPEAGTNHFSCATTNSSNLRTCTDYSYSGSTPPSSLAMKCMTQNGMPGMACDHAHSEGGCLFTETIDGVEVSYVYWYFYDSPESIMAACAEAKVPYVAP